MLQEESMKVYAVKKGFQTGLFNSWEACQKATKGFSNPEFKSFNSEEEAEAYLNGVDLWKNKVAEDNANGFFVAFTDGSFDDKLKRYSYGVVFITPEGKEDSICGYGNNEKYIESKNIIGEIFGVIYALDSAISKGYSKIKIYHDYEGLSKWLSGEWKASTEASKMYVNLFKAKYEGLIEVAFEKVSGHSNIIYNDKADQTAKSALIDRKKVAIQGANWYSIPYFSEEDFEAFTEIVLEMDGNISCTKDNLNNKTIYRFALGTELVTVTWFKGGNHKLLVQGKNTYLFQVITTTLVELDDTSKVEQIMGSAYRISINESDVEQSFDFFKQGFSVDYPDNIKRLIRQSIINLKYSIESEDYTQYAFPALRALEGHIKYLIVSAGGNNNKFFNTFNRNSAADPYYYTGKLLDTSKITSIEQCFNYYKSQRDTAFHFGDILGCTDSTRLILNKVEADEIIQKCLSLINENM